MTCREKLKLEHPELVNPTKLGGCYGCPSDYGYQEKAEWCEDSRYSHAERCTRCWDRECSSAAKTGILKRAINEYVGRLNHDEYARYVEADIDYTNRMIIGRMKIKNVIFNDPATIVFWADGTKTVVKCQDGDVFDPEKGLAIAISKKALGNKGNFNNEFKKWLPEETAEDIGCIALTKLSETMSKLTIPKLNVLIKKRTNEDEKND